MANLFYTRYLKPPPTIVTAGKPFNIVWTVANDLGEISYWQPLTICCRLIPAATSSSSPKTATHLTLQHHGSSPASKKKSLCNMVELQYDPVKGGGVMTTSLVVSGSSAGSRTVGSNSNSVTFQLVLELAGSQYIEHPVWTRARLLKSQYDDDDDDDAWVIPVFSLPVHLATSSQQHGKSSSVRDYERRVTIKNYSNDANSTKPQQHIIRIHEDASPSIGSHIWDCGMLMCQYLAEQQYQQQQPHFDRILELGSGTAIAGIYAAHMLNPSIIYLTDLDDTVPTVRHNVSLQQHKAQSEKSIVVEELEWGQTDISNKCVNLVLLTDVLYNPAFHDALIDTLSKLVETNPKLKVLLGYKPRDQGEERTFFDKIGKLGWQWQMSLLPPAEIYWISKQ
ncbi:putative methyltransferase-domain-containing protein [Zychaea mexicana]|uniref:putative methyltransferase-domain-containing protein n=1 Tax=Zychaea mexicana TaxID=64656 RepID=UPI0022FE0D44|nr:putative methyltransferase-domain-containing protein [Zychaea mexicana]KAI9493939.1 putative methyltransferase-domain-containing protein [Zychaea mexicana]